MDPPSPAPCRRAREGPPRRPAEGHRATEEAGPQGGLPGLRARLRRQQEEAEIIVIKDSRLGQLEEAAIIVIKDWRLRQGQLKEAASGTHQARGGG